MAWQKDQGKFAKQAAERAEQQANIAEGVIEEAQEIIGTAGKATQDATEAARLATEKAEYITTKQPIIEKAITDSTEAKGKSTEAKTTADSVKAQFDRVVAEAGSNNPEVVQARGNEVNLNARLEKVTTQLADTVKEVNGIKPTGGKITLPIPQIDTSNLATKQELQNIGNASPKGTYDTVAALQTAFPSGTTGIYVVSEDGKWYYWNGTMWTSGGVYQSTGIADKSINLSKTDDVITNAVLKLSSVYTNEYPVPFVEQSSTKDRAKIIGTPVNEDSIIKKIKFVSSGSGTLTIGIFNKGQGSAFTPVKFVDITNIVVGDNVVDVEIEVNKGQYVGVWDKGGKIKLSYAARTKHYIYRGDAVPPVIGTEFVASEFDNAILIFSYLCASIPDRIVSLEKIIKDRKPGVSIGTGINPTSQNVERLVSKRPLFIPEPYGYKQPYHPSVEYFENGWNGWKYWMAETPYPIGGMPYKARFENPCIHVSNDGVNWFNPQGLSNPIDDLTNSEILNKNYMSDTELIYRSDTKELECWYRITYVEDNNNTLILRKKTSDGVNWSAREVMIDSWATEKIRSHGMIYENGKYKMWYTGSRLPIGYGESVDGYNWTFSNCKLDIDKDGVWHLDAGYDKTKNNYFLITYSASHIIRYYNSSDGFNWTYVKDILKPEEGTFYNRGLYRASAVFNGSHWLLYFSAQKDVKFASIGLMIGLSLDNLDVVDGGYSFERPVYRDGISLMNTDSIESPIILAPTGECIGFDSKTKTLFFQRADGTRISIIQ